MNPHLNCITTCVFMEKMENYPYNPFLSCTLDNLNFHGNLGIIIKNLSQLCFLTIMILIEKINQGVKSFFAHLELLSGKLLFLLNMYTNFVGLSHIFRYFAVCRSSVTQIVMYM